MKICTFSITPFLFLIYLAFSPAQGALDFNYHGYEALASYLQEINRQFPNQTSLYDIGSSVRGRKLYVLMIANGNPLQLNGRGYRHIKLIGNIHGDEPVGKEILLQFIDYLLPQGGINQLSSIFSQTILHILPSMNPDGFEAKTRANANGFDLNRNFPDFFETNSNPLQPEARAISGWLSQYPFVFSVSFHGGALVVNYPYDNKPPSVPQGDYPTPDNDVFVDISKTYASAHPTMADNSCGGTDFVDGITNGVAWYPVKGGMQDFNYVRRGIFELTIEVSCLHYPPSGLQGYFRANQQPIIDMLNSVQRGVSGFIKNAQGQPVSNAQVFVDDRLHPVYSSRFGEYFRILLPGTYQLTVSTGGRNTSQSVTIPSSGRTQLNITV